MNLHPAISYELSQTRIADWRRQAQRDGLARAAAHPQTRAPRPDRKWRPVSLYFLAGNRRRPDQVPAT
jgi:transposase-like protein